jgi:hypothetical protein
MKLPVKIEKEEDITPSLLRELLMIYVKNIVKSEGDFLDAWYKLDGDILVTLHNGKIAKGSKASINLQKEKVYVKLMEG